MPTEAAPPLEAMTAASVASTSAHVALNSTSYSDQPSLGT